MSMLLVNDGTDVSIISAYSGFEISYMCGHVNLGRQWMCRGLIIAKMLGMSSIEQLRISQENLD